MSVYELRCPGRIEKEKSCSTQKNLHKYAALFAIIVEVLKFKVTIIVTIIFFMFVVKDIIVSNIFIVNLIVIPKTLIHSQSSSFEQ